MLLLHAGVIDDEFLLWGERSASSDDAPAAFAPAADLAAALTPRGALRAGPAKTVRGVVAWIPSAQGEPVHAPLSTGGDRGVLSDCIAPYRIDALPLDVPMSLSVLRRCAGKRLLIPGTSIGRDLAFWSHLLRYASTLVARQHYIPSLERTQRGRPTRYRARWQPRYGHAERAELGALAVAMPAVCRALAAGADAPPAAAARDIVRSFVDRAVDELVRTSSEQALSGRMRDGTLHDRWMRDGTLHDRWMRALRSEDRTLVAKTAELETFATHVAQWVRETTREDDAEYRLCLRLEEPLEDNGSWFVRYLLQAHSDPSLLVSLDSAWNKAPLRRAFLAAIGKAAQISASVDATLRETKPLGYALDDVAAHAFLTVDAPLLAGAGNGVLLPAWWTPGGSKLRLGARASVKSKGAASSGFTLGSVVEVNWKVALGGEALTPKELSELARLKAPLIKLRGQWVSVEAADIRAALELRDRRTQTLRLGDVAQMALTGRDSSGTLRVESVTGTGGVGKLLDRLAGRAAFEELAVPKSLLGTLRPYQVRGYSWLRFLSQLGLGACLADDMGLGKSITTLALVARDWDEEQAAPVLLVCPTSVIGNWQREIARFAPHLPVTVYHGGERKREGRLLSRGARFALVLTSYGVLLRDLARLRTVDWRGIVLDEAQNIKNAESKAAQAARALGAGYRVALTGTPIENHVGDLWSLMEFLNPGVLGTAAAFRREFLIPISALGDAEAEARLKRTTAPLILRRLKSDPTVIADLPQKLEMRVFCQLTKEQASLYAAVLRDVELQLEAAAGIERRGLILATITKLKQVCNHPANFLRDNSALRGRSGKLARLAEMLEEVWSAGERALVFTQFTEMATLLRRYLQETTGREVAYLHGALSKRERDRIVERFQGAGDAPGVFILSLRAGGTGLNLTRANHVFHFDRWWNPAVENQASDRAYRIGQTKNVHVHRLVCAGTIEDKIDALLERKGAVANRLVRSGEAGLTELTNAQLRDLFALGADALAPEAIV